MEGSEEQKNLIKKPRIKEKSYDFFKSQLSKKEQETLLDFLHNLLKFREGTFPGAHNVTFMRKHFNNLLENDYLCTEKSDGKRVLFLILDLNLLQKGNKSVQMKEKYRGFWMDRTNNIYAQTDMQFSISQNNIKNKGAYFFDCELVENHDKSYNLYIFDALIYQNQSICHYNLLQRLECGRLFLKNFQITNLYVKFEIKLKQMYKSYGFSEIYRNIDKLKHENDGLCFTPLHKKYMIGVDTTWFKWKPSHLNTIDFRLFKMTRTVDRLVNKKEFYLNLQNRRVVTLEELEMASNFKSLDFTIKEDKEENSTAIYGMFLCDQNKDMIFYDYYVPLYDTSTELKKYFEKSNSLNGLVCEFHFNSDMISYDVKDDDFSTGNWTLFKIRFDKVKSNTVKIAKNIMVSINEEIGIKELESKFSDIRKNWKKREMKKIYR